MYVYVRMNVCSQDKRKRPNRLTSNFSAAGGNDPFTVSAKSNRGQHSVGILNWRSLSNFTDKNQLSIIY